MFDEADDEITASVHAFADILRALGASIERRPVKALIDAQNTEERGLLMTAEAWQNNAEILQKWGADRDRLTDWIMDGQDIPADRLPHLRAVQRRLQRQLGEEMQDIDALLVPTVRRTTRPIAEVDADFGAHHSKYVGNTMIGNYLNMCGLSLPSGLDSAQRPIGAMILAPAFADALVLSIGIEIQASGLVPQLTPDMPG